MRDLFLLDPEIIFLNHGSFGACPRVVFETYQAWQRRLEGQPVLFLGREFNSLMQQSRQALGEYLNATTDDLVYIPNATYGVNIVAHSLDLQDGDEIMTSDHEYGACDNAWEFACKKTGAKYIHLPVTLPVTTEEEIVERFMQFVTGRTRVIYLSHITSPTGLRLPVEAICQRARQAGIITVIDGAHAPGQISLDMQAIGADFYTGNLHKWALAPKGAAFLYARPGQQGLIQPLVVSWGYSANSETTTGSRYLDLLQWTGTHDPSAALSVPAALQFMADHPWDEVRAQCKTLLTQAVQRISQLFDLPGAYPLDSGFYSQMAVAPLPASADLVRLKAMLYNQYKIEIPCIEWQGHKFLRISVQGYNTQEDIDCLLKAINEIIYTG